MDLSKGIYGSFEKVSSWTKAAQSAQGVATDNNHVFITTNNLLERRSMTGSLVTSRNCVNDGTTDHLGDLTYNPDDNHLYVASSNYPTVPRVGYVMKYSVGLNYIGEYNLFNNKVVAGIAYRDNSFWVVADFDTNIYQFSTAFVLLNTYPTDIILPSSGRWAQGIEFVGDECFVNMHENDNPETVIQLHFDGTNFITKQYIRQPDKDCTQGLAWNPATNQMLFALRGYDGRPDGVVFAYPRPLGGLRVGAKAGISAAQTIAPGSWVKINFNVARWDIGNHFDVLINERFVAPVTGLYDVRLGGGLNDLADTKQGYVAIFVNGAEVVSTATQASKANHDVSPFIADVVYALAGQVIEGYVYNSDTVNRTLRADSTRTFITITLYEKITV